MVQAMRLMSVCATIREDSLLRLIGSCGIGQILLLPSLFAKLPLLLLPPSPDPVWPDYYTHDFVLTQTDTYKYRSSPEHPVIHQAL